MWPAYLCLLLQATKFSFEVANHITQDQEKCYYRQLNPAGSEENSRRYVIC